MNVQRLILPYDECAACANDIAAATLHDRGDLPLRVTGSGPRVLLLHDLARTAEDLAPLKDAVLQDDHAAAVADFSTWRDGETLRDIPARVLTQLRDALGAPLAVIAHGTGCEVALAAMRAGLRVNRAVLIEPSIAHVAPDPMFPPMLVLASGTAPRRGLASARTVVLEPSRGRNVASDPYVVATAIAFAVRGRLPMF